ncbi:class I SAM-dependent RNA methyltransferase [bacterium]|nr:class I SAM-dependent RNA methyltransferase [bacterium]
MYLYTKKASYFFAPSPRGLESALSDELEQLGALNISSTDGGVHFEGDFSLVYKVNLHSRIASRILWKLAVAGYREEQDIYDAAAGLPWEEWFSSSHSIRVDSVAIRCPLKSINFVSLRVKDAICDRFREKEGVRPDVDKHTPDMRIHLFLDEKNVTISLDTSGEPLFKRGVRQVTNVAPIRENLAAGILHIAGWKPGIPLLDPMCGSGTFLIEAAQMSLGIAPGIDRKFAFEKMVMFDAEKWKEIHNEALNNEKDIPSLPIFGSDLSNDALQAARFNLGSAGLLESISLKQADILDISAPQESGVLVANMPYGERMGEREKLRILYPQLGDLFKKKFAGWNAYLFTSDMKMPKSIRLSVSKRTPLFNGAIECRLFEYKMVSGSNRKEKPVKKDTQAT